MKRPQGGERVTAKVGDHIVVESEQVGTPPRQGEVLEVLEGNTTVRYRVRWEDGHESIYSPAAGATTVSKQD